MRNEKQNDFWVNQELFTTSFLKNRITREKDFPSIDAPEIRSLWEELRGKWLNADTQRILKSENVRESVTEDHWIDPVLKVLGYSTLSKIRLGEKSFPDYTLFSSASEVADALDADEEYRFTNALAILEGKYFGRDLFNSRVIAGRDDRSNKGLPSVQLNGYLKTSDLRWGILTNGEQWQLYYGKGVYAAARYFEINLVDLLDHPQITTEFCLFAYLFSADAFKRNGEICRLDRLLINSQKYAQEMGPSFFEGCAIALKSIFSTYQKQDKALKSLEKSEVCHQAAVILLFRLIAIRFLEDRGILPTQVSKYRKISLDVIRTTIERTHRGGRRFSKTSTDIHQKLRLLFADVNNGTFGVYPGHKGFESGLFDIDFDQYFRSHILGDDVLADAIDAICRGAAEPKAQFDFFDLGVQKIGDVYNDLLGLRLFANDSGTIVLEESSTKKKELGSYFTHPALTHLVSESTISYLARRYPKLEDWLKLKFCDNSCGSGHFLRQIVEDISYHLYISPMNASGEDDEKVLEQNSFRRMLAQHCVYGVDRDTNAVWLSKLSLWLQTAEMGKPFVYLDPHIVRGDSILSSIEKPDLDSSTRKELGRLLKKINTLDSDARERVVEARRSWDTVFAHLRRCRKIDTGTKYLSEVSEEHKRSFFRYAETFPDVFLNSNLESPGFSVIVGNPPWDTIEPKVSEFYQQKTGVKTPPKRKQIDRWLESSQKIKAEFDDWKLSINQYADGVRKSGYELQKGKVHTYAYFIERSMQTLQAGGLLSYVVKLGLYGDEMVGGLRGYLFTRNTVSSMWVFKKNKIGKDKLFAKVDSNEKFLVFNCEKKFSGNYSVNAKNIKELSDITVNFEDWQSSTIPADLNELNIVQVFDSEATSNICKKMSIAPTIKSLGVTITTELNTTSHRKYFSEHESQIPIYSGYEVQHYNCRQPSTWCNDERIRDSYTTATAAKIGVNKILPNSRRKLRASIIPEGSLTADSVLVICGIDDVRMRNLVLASLNSLLTEYKLRPLLSNMNLNIFRLEALPIPLKADSDLLDEISEQVEKLLKAKQFNENSAPYRKIEALLAVAYQLTNSEISTYLKFFSGIGDAFIDAVIDQAEIARDLYKKRRVASK
jgi:hypothetical protein